MHPALPAPALIISDAHVGVGPPDVERTLLAFCQLARTAARSVVINGDLFDFWFEWRHVMPRVGFRTLAALAALRESGVEVLWVAGNHDCWGGDVLAGEGVTYHVGPWRGTVGPWTTLIEHGDGLRDIEDAPYRRLRAVLRNPFAIWAFRRLVHPDWASTIARRSSHTSRSMRPRDDGAGLQQVALARLAADPSLQLYVFGHTHAQTLERAPGGGLMANPGAWLDGPTALLVRESSVALAHCDGAIRVTREIAR